jgi:hypothetical protein
VARGKQKENECRFEGCNEPVYSRGLCTNCYGAVRRRVVSGKTTWEQLEAKKIALPPKKASGRRPRPIGAHVDRLIAAK